MDYGYCSEYSTWYYATPVAEQAQFDLNGGDLDGIERDGKHSPSLYLLILFPSLLEEATSCSRTLLERF